MTKKATTGRQKPETQSVKKPYLRPHLVEYGNVAKLTSSGGTSPNTDGIGTFMAS